MRPIPVAVLTLLLVPAAASAERRAPVPVPVPVPVEVGEPAAAALGAVRERSAVVGRLLVERTGDRIRATTQIESGASRRKVTLCVTVGGLERCVRRRPGRRGVVRLDHRGAFEAPLVARTRWGAARGVVRL